MRRFFGGKGVGAAGRIGPKLATITASLLIMATAAFAPPVRAAESSLTVARPGYRLVLDEEKGTIKSFQSTFGVDRDLLISSHASLPLFKIEFMNDRHEFKTVTSSEAARVNVARTHDANGVTVTMEFKSLAQLPLDARVTIHCPQNESLTYWNLELDNRTNLWIGHIQFPVVELPFDAPDGKHSSHILWPFADGMLAGPVVPTMLVGGLGRKSKHDAPELWRFNNYPGQWATLQLMAYYNDDGGLYVACDDPAGLPKFIDPLVEDDGVALGVGHYPGTRGRGKYSLPYHVVLGTFHGDWYSAAEIYRDWASKQSFLPPKLAQRADVPQWLVNSPPALAFPMRGHGDGDPPAAENPEYTPLTNALPLLENWSEALRGSIAPIVFNWERAGPWVQPDAFPPLGGESSFREFMIQARARGWHPMLYGDGLTWAISQQNTHYDGMPYFHAHGGDALVTRRWDGSIPEFNSGWRNAYLTCVGTEKGRQMVLDMTRQMAAYEPAVIQQFDQGAGPRACFAPDHGHPPVPGPWMTEDFAKLLKADEEVARSADPGVAMSCEGAPPEIYLKNFQVWDARIHLTPLFSYVYHEYANGFEGLYTNRVNDVALRASVARALVDGYITQLTLREKGLAAFDWNQPWDHNVPDQLALADWVTRARQFRSGVARDYLMYGRMLAPWKVGGVTQKDFGWGLEPMVRSATWQAQNGTTGVVLVNYGDSVESPRVELQGQGMKEVTIDVDGNNSERTINLPTTIQIKMGPRSLGLVELK